MTDVKEATWVTFIKEMMEELVNRYIDNRSELRDYLVNNVPTESVKCLLEDDGTYSMDFDPITLLGTSIFYFSNEQRRKPLDIFKNMLNLSSAVPSDYSSWVVLGYIKRVTNNNLPKADIDAIWQLANAVLHGGDVAKWFDHVMPIVSAASLLTAWMYYLSPDKYLPLGLALERYCKDHDINYLTKLRNFEQYQQFCQDVKGKLLSKDLEESSIIELVETLVGYNGADENKLPRLWIWHEVNLSGSSYLETGIMPFNNSNNDDELMHGIYESVEVYGKSKGKEYSKRHVQYAFWRLVNEISEGDVIVLVEGSYKIKAWGYIASKAKIDPNRNVHKYVEVQWVNIEERVSPFQNGGLFFQRASLDKVKKLVRLLDIPVNDRIKKGLQSPQLKSAMKISKYQQYIDLLKESRNLVLTGAPGTGKTFMAQAIAEEMGAEIKFVQFHPSYDYTDFVEGLRPVDNGNGQMGFERKDGVFKEFCKTAIKNIADSEKSVENLTKELSWQDKLEQFVEDAMENEKKFKTVNGSEFSIADMKGHTIVVHNEQNEKTTDVTVNADEILDLLTQEVELKIVRDIRNHYGRKFGTQPDSYAFVIVKEIRAMKTKVPVATADKVEKKPFVLIIDEINRGEASKIFGELFYAIDPGYRGKTNVLVQTQYQNLVPESDVYAKGFYVPENVYILATMNDIDRSVESMDFAMRRRFTWQEVTPTDTQDMLDSLSCSTEAKDAMNRLNQLIADTDGLGAAYMIGPSYFLKLKENGGNFDKLWTMNIEPLLKEYLRGFRKAAETLDQFKVAYYKKEEETADTSDLFDEEN